MKATLNNKLWIMYIAPPRCHQLKPAPPRAPLRFKVMAEVGHQDFIDMYIYKWMGNDSVGTEVLSNDITMLPVFIVGNYYVVDSSAEDVTRKPTSHSTPLSDRRTTSQEKSKRRMKVAEVHSWGGDGWVGGMWNGLDDGKENQTFATLKIISSIRLFGKGRK